MADPTISLPGGETDDRTALISARLKQLYSKSILPVEKKYKYDYFFESPLLSDVEFDGKYKSLLEINWWILPC